MVMEAENMDMIVQGQKRAWSKIDWNIDKLRKEM